MKNNWKTYLETKCSNKIGSCNCSEYTNSYLRFHSKMNTSLTFFFLGLNWNSLRVHILHHLQMGSMQLKHCLTFVWNRVLISGFRSLANSCKYLADVSVNFRSMPDRCASQAVASIVGWPFPSAPMKKKYDLFTFVSHFLCSKNKCLLKHLCTFSF